LGNSVVRPMKPSEAHEVVQLWRRLAQDMSGLGGTHIVDDESLRRFHEFLEGLRKEDENQVLVSEINARIVGFLTFMKQAGSPLRSKYSRATIEDLYVDEDYRRTGIATELLERCLEYLRSRAVEEVRVNVLANNTTARNLYRKLGFSEHMIIVNKRL